MPIIDFIHVCHGDRYWSIRIPVHDPTVKVTDLYFLSLSFVLKTEIGLHNILMT